MEKYVKARLLPDEQAGARFPESRMALSEIMAIAILFQLSGYRCFKWYYNDYAAKHLGGYFPRLVSYNRFVELMGASLMPLALYAQRFRAGTVTGISHIDSTPIKACHCRRMHSHKALEGAAKRGKNSTGWFCGFKLHLVINEMGEILSFYLSPGNVDDRNRAVIDRLCRDLWGKLFGDRGYISKELFELLYLQGIRLITRLKKNMKNVLIDIGDKLLLRKRPVIESVNDFLKNICQVEPSESCELHGQPAGVVGCVQFSAAQTFHSDEGRKGTCFDPRLVVPSNSRLINPRIKVRYHIKLN